MEIIEDLSQAYSSKVDIDILNILKDTIDTKNIDNFIQKLKQLLSQTQSRQGLLNLLEVVEFLTCQEEQVFITQFSSKRFLQIFNKILVDEKSDVLVKQKILKLVSLWHVLFSSQRKFKNFEWYYKCLVDRGIPLSNQASSQYWKSQFKVTESDQVSDINQSNYTQREKKLLQDLEIVRDLLILNNEVITNGELEVARELFIRLKKMDQKMSGLPQKLQDNKEVFFYNYVIALQSDIDQTKSRLICLKDKNIPQLFRSRVAKVVKDEVRNNGKPQKITPQNKPSYFETPKHEELQKISEVIEEDPFEKLNNVYYQDSAKSQNKFKSDVKNKSELKQEQQQPQKKQEQPKNDNFDIFDLKTITDPKTVEKDLQKAQNVKFGPPQNFEFDIDFMNINPQQNTSQQQPIQQSNTIQPVQTKHLEYQPADMINFEKQEKVQIKKQDKIEYDPFSNINDLNFEPIQNYQKKDDDEADFLFQFNFQRQQVQKNG